MSMNFAREQSLLRQKLQAKASPERAAARTAALPGVTFLGAADDDVATAAAELTAAWPQMGRAQMTAFVRTLWNSKIHELRAVGAMLLAARRSLLEPADLPLLETFLLDVADDAVKCHLARDVIGAITTKNKKLWKDLKRFAGHADAAMRLAGVRAMAQPLADDAEAFPRFVDVATPLLTLADAVLQAAIDDVLVACAAMHYEAATAFAQQHARSVTLEKPKPVAPPPPPVSPPVAPAIVAAKPAAKAAKPTKVAKPAAAAKPAPTKAAKKPVANAPKKAKPAAKKPGAAAKASGRARP